MKLLDLSTVGWPLSRLGEAMDVLASRGGLSSRSTESANPPDSVLAGDLHLLDRWLEASARWLGLEAQHVEALHGDVSRMLADCGPALVRLRVNNIVKFCLVLRSRGDRLELLKPDLTTAWIPVDQMRFTICRRYEQPLEEGASRLLKAARVPEARREIALSSLLGQKLRQHRIAGVWVLRHPPGDTVWKEVRRARLHLNFVMLCLAHTFQYLLFIGAWWLLGKGALQGSLDTGWIVAWALMLLATIPVRLIATWYGGTLAIDGGALLKQRVLQGALKLRPGETRHQGVGQMLGRVIESEAVETLAMSGGFIGIMAVLELAMSTAVLAAGAGGALHALGLFLWIVLTGLVSFRYYKTRRAWAVSRVAITHDLVERMVAHRTRLAQEPMDQVHAGEDQSLESYHEQSTRMDWAEVIMASLLPWGWVLVGLVGMAPAFLSSSSSPGLLAASLGGVLLAKQALQRLVSALGVVAGAGISWEQVRPLFLAAEREEVAGRPAHALARQRSRRGETLLSAHELVFRYAERAEPILKKTSLDIDTGDRVLLEGASGSGKSTLGSILAGVRQAESGLVLLGGLDWQTLGREGWRRRVVTAPQFHENHVLSGTFGFNLLMGRGWPPTAQDYQEAREVCAELGLSELLQRMPSGFEQPVGETGWQLSHGERSRVFIARALLQGSDLVVLDESFAALDPPTLRQAMACVEKRARSLLVIAHP